MSSVDLNLLVAFDSLMAERNVTRAAERNGLTQPAVSKALNRLRYLFGDPLFVRRDRAMEPTARALELAGIRLDRPQFRGRDRPGRPLRPGRVQPGRAQQAADMIGPERRSFPGRHGRSSLYASAGGFLANIELDPPPSSTSVCPVM